MSARAYGVADLVFATLYAVIGFSLAPSRSFAFQGALAIVILWLAATGVALLVFGDSKASRALGVITCSLMVGFTAIVLVLLAMSAAYLYGVYGAVGHALSALTLVGAALVVELFGLLPLFQLRFHLRR